MGELVTEKNEVEVSVDKIKESRTNIERHFDENKVAQLVESIKLLGLRHAITLSEDYVLIAGRHRLAAVKRLGKKTIKAEILSVSGITAELVSIDENLIHASLTYLEESEHLRRREEILAELGQRAPPYAPKKQDKGKRVRGAHPSKKDETPPIKTTKDIAAEAGMSERSAQERLQVAKSIDKSARDKLRDVIDISDNKSELIRLAKVDNAEDQNIIADMIVKGECKTIKEAVSLVIRDKQRKDFAGRAAEVKKLPDTIKLIHKDFFDAEGDEKFLKHNSIDAIITDPPYIDSWKLNWAPFLGIAADILKPGGFLISYTGHIRLPEFFEALFETQIDDPGKVSKNNRLEFFWICFLKHQGSIKAVHARSVQCSQKPILIAYKPPMKQPYKYFSDVVIGSGREKGLHAWQQGTNELIPLIDAFTSPGSLVLDPFAGSCTTAVACKMTARRCICYDLDEENIKIGTTRILDAEPLDM